MVVEGGVCARGFGARQSIKNSLTHKTRNWGAV